MREDEGIAHVQRVEHGGDAIGLGGERVIRLLGPGGRADAQRLDDDRPITRADEERDQLAETERRAEEPRNERSEEHTAELQSRPHLVCRLLLEQQTSALRLYLASNLSQ